MMNHTISIRRCTMAILFVQTDGRWPMVDGSSQRILEVVRCGSSAPPCLCTLFCVPPVSFPRLSSGVHTVYTYRTQCILHYSTRYLTRYRITAENKRLIDALSPTLIPYAVWKVACAMQYTVHSTVYTAVRYFVTILYRQRTIDRVTFVRPHGVCAWSLETGEVSADYHGSVICIVYLGF